MQNSVPMAVWTHSVAKRHWVKQKGNLLSWIPLIWFRCWQSGQSCPWVLQSHRYGSLIWSFFSQGPMCNPGYKMLWQTMTWGVSVLVWAEDPSFPPRDGKCLGLLTFRPWPQLSGALLTGMSKLDFPWRSEQGSGILDTATRPASRW